MKKFRNLDKTWKELLYAASGLGPNLLMVLMGAYFTDAVNPVALDLASNPGKGVQAITGFCLIAPAIFPILWFIGKAFDGIIDVPLAALTDSLNTKWGRRRLPIAICFLPMVVSYVLCWIPISSEPNSVANTVWIFIWALVFFATYTMNLIAFYGSLSTVCADESQRLRVSSYKSFFDTISYVATYALVPLILGGTGLHIDKLVFILCPLMLTMLIPVFMIKEGDKWERKAIADGYDITPLAEEPRVKLRESIKLTFVNKPFMKWCLVNCCAFFGLQMFLVSMNALILGGMGMNSTQMAILNTCAFAPVPVMLYLFNKLKKKKGIRFAFQTCLVSFAVCILSFFFGSTFVAGDNTTMKIVIGAVGGLVGSWAIGSFFMMPYMVPAQISSVEEKLTHKNHSAMYFAAQALTTSIVGAVASSLVYENIKMLFISKNAPGVVYASDKAAAAAKFGADASSVFNLGTMLVPFIVSVFCILGFILAFRMPKNYSPKEVAKELGLEKEYEAHRDLFDEEDGTRPFTRESLIVHNALWVLSGCIFGFIWLYQLISAVNTFAQKKTPKWFVLISLVCLPFTAFAAYKLNREVNAKCDALSVAHGKGSVAVILFAAIGLNCVSLSIIQHKLNRIADAEAPKN
ncbi:MAG: MFS transporter [Clostridia bacterium]|nr:MFS transporter [Clostridia bacterium]